MIYLVTSNQELFESQDYKIISKEQSLEMIKSWNVIQFDTETSGRNPHICDLLCAQFGNKKADTQIVVDCTCIQIEEYKEVIESRYLIGHNLKFDLQFLFKHGIIPRKIYDTMIVEQLLYLGYPSLGNYGGIGYSLKAVAERYLNIDIDKSTRGEIIWRGLDSKVIQYAAGDVMYLEDIADKQYQECVKKNCIVGAKLECDAVPAMAYLEWCGIKLDVNKWKAKMAKDQAALEERKAALDNFVIKLSEEGINQSKIITRESDVAYDSNWHPCIVTEDIGIKVPKEDFQKYVYIDLQGNLFTGFDTSPHCIINWDSAKQVIPFVKLLGFNTTIQDKKTGEDKETVLEKELSNQKGINDEFLKLYFDYKEASKVVGTYGQGHLDLINPITGRLHTSFKQLGAATGRMSSGGGEDTDLAKYKKIRKISLVNMQQLPHDAETRACFVAEKGNKFVSCDFSAEESRLAADIYNDEEMKKEFTERSGDTHAMFAWAVFRKECEACGCTSALEVKKKAPQWRNAVKAVEFAYLFGAAAPTIAKSANCSVEQAQKYIDDLDQFFKGRTAFFKKGSAFVRNNGYVLISPITGHKVYWWDWKEWKARQEMFTPEFWEDYRKNHKGTGDDIAIMVRNHFQAASKYDRYALNSPTQGTGACVMKDAITSLFNYIINNHLFNVVKLCVVVHDEINCEYPESLKEFPSILANIMKSSAAKYCKSIEIPAVPEVSDYWVH